MADSLEEALGALGLLRFLPKLHNLGLRCLSQEALPEALDPELEAEAASGQEEEAAIVWSAPAMATANAAPFESFFRLDLDSDSPSAKLPEALRRRLETRRETRRSTLSKRIKEEPSREEPAKAEPKKPEPSKRTFSSRLGRTRPGEEAPGAGAAMAMNTPRGAAAARGGGGLRCPIPKQSRSCQDSEPSERQMFDKVTLRLRHRQLFIASIEKHGTAETKQFLPPRTPRRPRAAERIQVFVRVRPFFDEDLEQDDFDVVSVSHEHVILHSCMFEADLKTPCVVRHIFGFDRVFGPAASNLCVYKQWTGFRQAAAPIIETSCSGGVGLLFMFGQTGSGKTHTMRPAGENRESRKRGERLWIERHAVHELAALEIFGSDPAAVGVQFLELRGDKAFDLLANPEGPRAGGSA
ncbi:Kif2c [Symbiodinium sp. KB8]|nr:Kif2c [Symbiodinium sp. KB8]